MKYKELLINMVPASIQEYKLVMVTFNMLVDKIARLPGKFGENWPTYEKALGGHKHLETLTQFVASKSDMDSESAKRMLARELANPDRNSFFNSLKHSPLGWPVVTAGEGNLNDFIKTLLPMDTAASGISGS